MNITLKKPLVYVTRDIERALGMEPGGNYFVISNDTPYGREVKARHPENVTLVDRPADANDSLDTYDLLTLPSVRLFIDTKKADLVVFQNTARIERLAQERGWNLLNPSAELSKKVEEKVSQIEWLGADANLLPPHKITAAKEVAFAGSRFVLQWNHSHTGEGTHIIESEGELAEIKAKFPDRECRIVDFISGPVFTMNVVAGRLGTIHGSTSYQITGLKPFTDYPFSTIGNDWALPYSSFFSDADRAAIGSIAKKVGRRMRLSGWRGLFGIDVVKDEKTGRVFLLEINARQPASTAYESKLGAEQDKKRATIFEAHLGALLGRLFPALSARVRTGSQIVKRVTERKHAVDVAALRAKNLSVMEYENSAPNKELFRIQSSEGIMEAHGKLNALGNFISSCIR